MSDAFIIDAHLHVGEPGVFFAPESSPETLLAKMDRLGIACSIGCSQLAVCEGGKESLPALRDIFERSGGRIHYLGVYDPRHSRESLDALHQAKNRPGLAGLKIHPSFHGVSAEDPSYEPAWRFAADHDLPMLTHSWSKSDYNPVQQLSTPARFEAYVRQFPNVRLVLGHAGGRGTGRHEAVRMANEYPNVWLDFAGDIYCYRLVETLVGCVPVDKILFGSDYPWLDPSTQLGLVFLSDIDSSARMKILRENALRVYRLRMK